MSAAFEERRKRGPRWPRILGGLVLVLISLLFVAGSAALVFLSPSENLVARIVGGVLCLVSLWLLVRGIRLLFDRPVRDGGLMSPLALRVAAVLFFCLPFIGLWTGYYQERGVLAFLQALMYLLVSAVLWRMARARSLRHQDHGRKPSGGRHS